LYPTYAAAYFTTAINPKYGRRWHGVVNILVIERRFVEYWKARRAGEPVEEGGSEAQELQAWYDRASEALRRYRSRQEEYRARKAGTPSSGDS
jgi:hypothetical protein